MVGEQWVVDHLQYSATLLGSSRQWTSFGTLPYCRGVVGSGSPSIHGHIGVEQWAVDLFHFIAT